MAYYQNATVDSDRIILGNTKIETAPSSGGTYVNLGAGQLTSWSHVFEKYTLQAGNAPDPLEGISVESLDFGFDLLEYDASAFSAAMGGLLTASVTTAQSIMQAGGKQVLTPRAWKFTNTRMISTTTVETVITVYKASPENGPVAVWKSDNDTDPMLVWQFTMKGELDSVRTAGNQLYNITKVEA